MGISSNQARFLALTARSVDLEFRTQQICQRRLRLSSELENVATDYNNQISNRSLYTYNTSNSGISALTLANLKNLTDTNGNKYEVVGDKSTNDTPSYVQIAAANVKGGNTTTTTALTIGSTNYSFAGLGLESGSSEADILEAALRAGIVHIATQSDEYTQDAYSVGTGLAGTGTALSETYEIKDWRTLPNIADELYAGDDTDAEDKYDATVTQINAQDKKLQLEQASIEVEYKAVTSEKEAVKKVLDTNAQTSFKYFS